MNFSGKLVMNTGKVTARYAGNIAAAQRFLDSSVLKDSEPYVPYKSGHLARSGQRGTSIGSGQVRYTAPYARKQYYLYPVKNTNVHKQASMQWFEKAKAVKKSDWMKGAKRIGGQGT